MLIYQNMYIYQTDKLLMFGEDAIYGPKVINYTRFK